MPIQLDKCAPILGNKYLWGPTVGLDGGRFHSDPSPQSAEPFSIRNGSGLDCDWSQILTQTHDTKGGSKVEVGGCVTQFSNEIIFIEHSRLNSNRVDCRTIASKALFEPIPEFNCNPCPICGHLDHS